MIVSNAHRFVYLRPPASEGAYVSETLHRYLTFRDVALDGCCGEAFEEAYAELYGLHRHSPIGAFIAEAGVGSLQDFFVFTFVRDPYARAVSLWRESGEGALEHYVGSRAFGGDGGRSAPQSRWVAGPDNRLAPGVDFVGRIETFEQDMTFVRSIIERTPFPEAPPPPPEGEDWRASLTDAAIEAIEKAYASDFDLFGYHRLSARAGS